MSSSDQETNIPINALTVLPDAVDKTIEALAQEQPRADKVATLAFLSDLDPDATTWCFQTFDDNANRKAGHLANTLTGTLDERWESLCSLSQAGAGVFVTVNETDGKGRKAENITRVRALFVDTDGADMEPILKHEPDILVASSPGNFHAYWLTSGILPDDFRGKQKRLIEAFGTDKSVHDLPRVLRLPGFPHQKVNVKKRQTGEKFQVAVVKDNSCCSDVASMGERRPPRDAEQTRVLLDAIGGGVSLPTKPEKVPRNELTVADVPAPTMGLSSTEIDDILARIPVASLDYPGWVRVGMALHHEGALFDVFERWSSMGDSRFDPNACRAKWNSFGKFSGQPVTMRTIILMANWDGGRAHRVVAAILKRLDAIVLPLMDKPYDPVAKFQDDFEACWWHSGAKLLHGVPFISRDDVVSFYVEARSIASNTAMQYSKSSNISEMIGYLVSVEVIAISGSGWIMNRPGFTGE
jgi:hypothetical protein